ncbi:hypothetical protein GALMADRAFT_67310 [Galerina marginata CBS 339.88]|uniref:CCHC-type domain-containing protein n=1 Tax=Galerina marginata (strain CBS 339.88) TaxID=685588 RepID=A0A067TC61_GALM3|nr:hypothetical protein GALMADRAFT_67310 [Galerina marginata CBS 339.88]
MTQLLDIQEFSGTQDDKVQPTEFLKSINRHLMITGTALTDETRISTIGNWLKTDSPAEDWYNEAATPKSKYTEFETAFKLRFPNVEKAKKTQTELERELAGMRIKTEDLGRTEKYKGQDVYTHVIFAEKILDLAKQAKIETTASGIFNVRDELPEVLREKISETQADWKTFATAIKNVDLSHIKEGVRKYKERAAESLKFQMQLDILNRRTTTNTQASPTKAIREQMTRTTISQPPAPHANVSNPFTGNNGGQGNLFVAPHVTPNNAFNSLPNSSRPPRLPPTEDEKAALRASIACYPIQPPTPQGIATYREQMRSWKQSNGDNAPSKYTGFPLRPGGAEPGTGECYGCGKTGHLGRDCAEMNKVPTLEGNFCAICGSILIPRRQPAQVNHVAVEEDEFAWANAPTTYFRQQGNGEGPPAY